VENHTKKITISLILIFITIIANVAILILLYPNLYQGSVNAGLLKPPTITSSSNPQTPKSLPSQTISPTLSLTPLQELTKACVHSLDYWSSHTETWPDLFTIGNLTYTKEEQITANNTPIKNVIDYLFIQLNAAYLNYVNGPPSKGIDKTITDTAGWLKNHNSVSELSESDRELGISMGMTLSDYNNGKLGPGLCANDPTSEPFKEIPFATATNTNSAHFKLKITFAYINTPSDTPKPQPPKPRDTSASTTTNTNIPLQPTITQKLNSTNTPLPLPTLTPPPEASPTTVPLPTPAPNNPNQFINLLK
jgi:hypothetical protein